MNNDAIYKLLADTIVMVGKKLLKETVEIDSYKNANDLLTKNDLAAERFIIDKIKDSFPNINIISEETFPNSLLEGICVVIDPLDGTCNFSVGNGLFGVQVALFENGVCEFSAIYIPQSDKLFLAYHKKGAYLNGKRIYVKDLTARGGILLISDYYDNVEISMDKQFQLVKNNQNKFLKTRHFGAACIDFTNLAEGKAAAYICYYSKLWDIAPGLLLVQEAGLVCGMLDGGEYSRDRVGLVVANNSEILDMIITGYEKL